MNFFKTILIVMSLGIAGFMLKFSKALINIEH